MASRYRSVIGLPLNSLDERAARVATGLVVWLAACGFSAIAALLAPGGDADLSAALAAAAPAAWCLGLRPFWRAPGGVLAAGAGFTLLGVLLAGASAAPNAGLALLLLGPALATALGRDTAATAAAAALALAAMVGLQAFGPGPQPLLDAASAWGLAWAAAAGVTALLLMAGAPEAPARNAPAARDSAETAALAHELRTPLHQILGFAEVIEERLFGDAAERYAEYAGHIRSSGRHLLQLADRWLLAAQLEQQAWTPQRERFDLAAMALETLQGFGETAARAGVRLEGQGLEQPVWIEADAQAWRQVLVNLLANALKFTPADGRVRVRLAGEGRCGLIVEDTGPGVPEAERARLLAPFARGAAAKGKDGVGLGLSIVHRLLAAHGAKLRIARSVDLGGARFEASAPARRLAAP